MTNSVNDTCISWTELFDKLWQCVKNRWSLELSPRDTAHEVIRANDKGHEHAWKLKQISEDLRIRNRQNSVRLVAWEQCRLSRHVVPHRSKKYENSSSRCGGNAQIKSGTQNTEQPTECTKKMQNTSEYTTFDTQVHKPITVLGRIMDNEVNH